MELFHIDKDAQQVIERKIDSAPYVECVRWIARLLLNIDITLQEIRDNIGAGKSK